MYCGLFLSFKQFSYTHRMFPLYLTIILLGFLQFSLLMARFGLSFHFSLRFKVILIVANGFIYICRLLLVFFYSMTLLCSTVSNDIAFRFILFHIKLRACLGFPSRLWLCMPLFLNSSAQFLCIYYRCFSSADFCGCFYSSLTVFLKAELSFYYEFRCRCQQFMFYFLRCVWFC